MLLTNRNHYITRLVKTMANHFYKRKVQLFCKPALVLACEDPIITFGNAH